MPVDDGRPQTYGPSSTILRQPKRLPLQPKTANAGRPLEPLSPSAFVEAFRKMDKQANEDGGYRPFGLPQEDEGASAVHPLFEGDRGTAFKSSTFFVQGGTIRATGSGSGAAAGAGQKSRPSLGVGDGTNETSGASPFFTPQGSPKLAATQLGGQDNASFASQPRPPFTPPRSTGPPTESPSKMPLSTTSSVMIHSGFWNILSYASPSRILSQGAFPPYEPLALEGTVEKNRRNLGYEGDTSSPLPMIPKASMAGINGVSGGKGRKRVSTGMISRPGGFTHLVHASDAEQAQTLLERWHQDGLGKVAPPHWASHIKDAVRARNVARGVAQVQENRDDDLDEQKHSLKVVNSTPKAESTCSTPTEDLSTVAVENEKVLRRKASTDTLVILPDPAEDSPDESLDLRRFSPTGGLPSIQPSLTTVEKATNVKIYFETYYHSILKKPRDRDVRLWMLEREMQSRGSQLSEADKVAIRKAWVESESASLREQRNRVDIGSFVKLKTIGHGAFGVVSLVREKGNGQVYAMKELRKADMLKKGQEGHVRAERDLLTRAASWSARWVVRLVYSFQDVDHLFLVMEMMGGGDLLNLLIEKDVFEESFAKFYIAEMVLAIEEAHKLGFIHRDIKPDNFLFDNKGHIKISDFGLATDLHWAHDGAYYEQRQDLFRRYGVDLDDGNFVGKKKKGGWVAPGFGGDRRVEGLDGDDGPGSILTWRDKHKRKLAYSVVGTNNYMSVEVIRGLGYDQGADWWSLGVILYEMLFGYPCFVSKSRQQTRQKIMQWQSALKFPPRPKVSREAVDLIQQLVCEKEDRIGSRGQAPSTGPNSIVLQQRRSGFFPPGQDGVKPTHSTIAGHRGADEIKAHPFFKGIDFATIHLQKPPFVPKLKDSLDTKYFDDDIDANPLPPPEAFPGAPVLDTTKDPVLRDKVHGAHLLDVRKAMAWTGWTFKSPRQVYDSRKGVWEVEGVQKTRGRDKKSVSKRGPGTSAVRSLSV